MGAGPSLCVVCWETMMVTSRTSAMHSSPPPFFFGFFLRSELIFLNPFPACQASELLQRSAAPEQLLPVVPERRLLLWPSQQFKLNCGMSPALRTKQASAVPASVLLDLWPGHHYQVFHLFICTCNNLSLNAIFSFIFLYSLFFSSCFYLFLFVFDFQVLLCNLGAGTLRLWCLSTQKVCV